MNGLGERPRKPHDSVASPAQSVGPSTGQPIIQDGAAKAVPAPERPAADRVVQMTIAIDDAGQRLDNFLFRHAKGVPKSHVYRIVRGGEVRVNGRRAEVSQKLVAGDVVRVPPLRVATRTTPSTIRRERAVAFTIVFEDDALLIVDKPAGVAVHGGSGISFGVIEQLRATRPDARFLELAHRLDRDTSGLLIIAKKRAALVALHDDLREGRVKKRYLALVAGAWRDAKRDFKAPLVKFTLPDGERRVRVGRHDEPDALAAHTIFRLKERFDVSHFALLDVELRTGRTHQIRVHLSHLGCPIVGDDKYGDYDVNHRVARGEGARAAFKRMFLHAAQLAFTHPVTGEALAIAAPLPPDCAALLAGLRAMPSPANR